MASTVFKSDGQLFDLLKLYFDSEFSTIESHQMGALSMIIFIRSKYENLVSKVETSEIANGLFGTMKNKGAIAVKFQLGDHKVQVINCHLEAHKKSISRRK